MARVTKVNVNEFQEILLRWFEENGRHFPWRERKLSEFQAVIAEVLLQRTKAETVAGFYHGFMKRFPNWKSIAIANVAEVEEFLKPIGLYRQRAKRLQSLAAEMVRRKGVLPKEKAELESLPMFGQYIVNAVELIIHKKPSPLVDVNMSRVLERYFGERKMADIRYDPYLQKLCYQVVNHRDTIKLNWAILDFAALICRANIPLCNTCPLNAKCTYFRKLRNANFVSI